MSALTFHGRPCIKCDSAERWLIGRACVKCSRAKEAAMSPYAKLKREQAKAAAQTDPKIPDPVQRPKDWPQVRTCAGNKVPADPIAVAMGVLP